MRKTYKHIAIEGIDGAGKSRQTALLVSHLREAGFATYEEREPSDTTEAGRIAREQLHIPVPEREISGEELDLLFAADRIVKKVRRRSVLESSGGVDVDFTPTVFVSDRSAWSSIAYYDRTITEIRVLNPPNLYPDLTVVLDIDPEVALNRIIGRREPLQNFETLDALSRTRSRYLSLATKYADKMHVIQCGNAGVYQVAQKVCDIVTQWLKNQ